MNGHRPGNRGLFLLLASLALWGIEAAGSAPSYAQTQAESACYFGKLDASRYGSNQVGRCQLALAQGGTAAAYQACLAKATTGVAALVASTDTAAAKSGFQCPGTMATLRLDAHAGWLAQAFTQQVVAGIALPNACVAKRIETLFKYAARYAECTSKGIAWTQQAIDVCAAATLTTMTTAWAKNFTPMCIGASFAVVAPAAKAAIQAQAQLVRVRCGDGIRAGTEQCDDGNLVAGDGCQGDCTLPLVCGDGVVQPANDEACDDGNRAPDDGCDALCRIEACGDGRRQASEGCDDGNLVSGDGCDEECNAEACGDAVRQASEDCDDGNAASGDGCSASCKRETCGLVSGSPRCLACPDGSHPGASYTSCVCDAGFALVGSQCVDIDECALGTDTCAAGSPCVNVPGSYSCPIACTEAAFHAALKNCGGPGRVITFDCSDTTIAMSEGGNGMRTNACSDLVIDGLDRNITFELAPTCWGKRTTASACKVPLNADGTCDCPEADSGTYFLNLTGSRMTVRNLTVKSFFEGIKTSGSDNTVDSVSFERICDEAVGNNAGTGNLFTGIHASMGCGKCMQNYGKTSITSPHPQLRGHYNAIVRDSVFTDCQQPIRMTEGGRFLIDGTRMQGFFDSGNFRCLGPRFDGGASFNQIVHMKDSHVQGCDRGVRIGGAVQAVLNGNTLTRNRFRGLLALNAARVSMSDNTITDNGGLGSSEPGLGGVAVDDQARLDLGGDALLIGGVSVTSSGGNRFCGNRAPNGSARDVHNLSASAVLATNDYWCTQTPQTRVVGNVVTSPFLTW